MKLASPLGRLNGSRDFMSSPLPFPRTSLLSFVSKFSSMEVLLVTFSVSLVVSAAEVSREVLAALTSASLLAEKMLPGLLALPSLMMASSWLVTDPGRAEMELLSALAPMTGLRMASLCVKSGLATLGLGVKMDSGLVSSSTFFTAALSSSSSLLLMSSCL